MIGAVPVPPGHINPATQPEPGLADASLGPPWRPSGGHQPLATAPKFPNPAHRVFFYLTTYDPHTQAADTQAIAGSQDRAGTKPEACSMEGDGKARAAPPCRDNNGKGTRKPPL
jgi:hypothetical protein